MQPANRRKFRIQQKSNSIVWLTAALLAILVIATISVAGNCLYHYAHRSDCQISLYEGQLREENGTLNRTGAASQNNQEAQSVLKSQATQYTGDEAKAQSEQSAFEVDDATQVWKTETAIELFQTNYKNAEGKVTVESADGRKVIAPGTEGSYTFSLKNTSNSSADYKVWVEATLSSNMSGVPLETRMSGNNGWLLGDKSTWEEADALNGVSTGATIDAGKTAEYTIYWQWPFEKNSDEADTQLGDASVEQEMSYTVTIYTLTAAATDGGSQNGSNDSNNQTDQNDKNILTRFWQAVKTGDTAQMILWTLILIASAGTLFVLFIWKRRKNDSRHEHDRS